MKGEMIKKLPKHLKASSPMIMSCIGIVGVVATAATAVQATPKALRLIEDATEEKGESLTKLETIRVAGPCYIPSILIGFGTIASIAGANILNSRKQAALTSSYIFLDRSFKEYRKKVDELFGENADKLVESAIVHDRYKESDITPKGETLIFYEEHYGKFFERTMLEVQDAEYLLNRKLAMDGEASLNDLFDFLGLPEMEIGDSLGWSQQLICDFTRPSWIDFEHELTTMDDGMECYIIHISIPPTSDYLDLPF